MQKKGNTVDQEGDKEECTIMEGFRYRVHNGEFPVYKGENKVEKYPIIPMGMLNIWRD